MAKKEPAEVKDFAEFCETLVLPSGGPMKLEPFQRLILRDYFAGVPELVAILPKKNGKTSLFAALALYHLLNTDDADVLVVANSSKQAMKLFDEARNFAKRTPGLEHLLQIHRGLREIRRRTAGLRHAPSNYDGLLYVAAADADTADGWGGTLALIDELHRAKSSELYGVIRDGLSPRSGQMITISTAGEDMASPLGRLRHKAYSMGVQRKAAHRYVSSGAFSLHEWALEATDDLEDIDLVATANPASWLTKKVLKERKESPNTTPGQWARMAAGVWGVGLDRAFDMEVWDELADFEQRDIEPGRLVTLGFSGSRTQSATALVACDVERGHLQQIGLWQSPGYDEDWEVPEDEVDDLMDYAFDRWNVWRLYGNPPRWESALDRWAGKFGTKKVVRWHTNRPKYMALSLLRFKTDMQAGAGTMSHDGDDAFRAQLLNATRRETKMVEDEEPLWLISKPIQASNLNINGAVGAVLAWTARGDALKTGATNRRTGAMASW